MSDPLRIVIVDDEAPARERLRTLIAEQPDFEIARECKYGLEAIDAIESLSPHVLFLDVQMPELDGFDVLQHIGLDAVPAIVFVTAYDAFALQAFEARAVDYLLKPFTSARFTETLHRVRRLLKGDGRATRHAAMHELIRSQPPQRVVVRDRHVLIPLQLADVCWMEADGNYVRLHSASRTGTIRGSLRDLSARFKDAGFVRISHSTAINSAHVREIIPGERGFLVRLNDGSEHASTRSYRKALDVLLRAASGHNG